MSQFVIGVLVGILLAILQPDISQFFVDSGMRDALVQRLNGV